MVVVIFLLAIARSVSYFISGNDSTFRFTRYLNISPYPVAFTHPTFFIKKEINLIYPTKTYAVNFMQNDDFFKNRANYRLFMFMFDAPLADRQQAMQFLYCEHLSSLGINTETSEALSAVEFVYHYADSPKKVVYKCRQ